MSKCTQLCACSTKRRRNRAAVTLPAKPVLDTLDYLHFAGRADIPLGTSVDLLYFTPVALTVEVNVPTGIKHHFEAEVLDIEIACLGERGRMIVMAGRAAKFCGWAGGKIFCWVPPVTTHSLTLRT